MRIGLRYGIGELGVDVPDGSRVFTARFPRPRSSADTLVMEALRAPGHGASLAEAVARRRVGEVVIVVSDITRPMPYAAFLPAVIDALCQLGVHLEEIVVLIATGFHRPTTNDEKRHMLGQEVLDRVEVVDHDASDDGQLVELPGCTWSGERVRLNRRFVDAGLRMITGLVEPHFMAGFSGGRKSICPGLCGLDTVRSFHGFPFLEDRRARPGQLCGNPLHDEAMSVARLVPVDLSLQLVCDLQGRVVGAFAGELGHSHEAAVEMVRGAACIPVEDVYPVVLTSSGGYPLDATFYQCVKGFVSCLPAVERGGTVIALGACSEGVGSASYRALLTSFAGRWWTFPEWARDRRGVVVDQWEVHMHVRALAKVGQENLHFITDGIDADELAQLSVTGHSVHSGVIEQSVQGLLDVLLEPGQRLAVFPVGPYCVPVVGDPQAEENGKEG